MRPDGDTVTDPTAVAIIPPCIDAGSPKNVPIEHPTVEATNNRSERNARREAEVRKGARTSKTADGAQRRGVILTVLASLATRFPRFTLENLLSEVTRWWETGLSLFQQELAELHQPNVPPTIPAEP